MRREDAGLFRSTDGGQNWAGAARFAGRKGHLWQPGAGGMCLHTILFDPTKSITNFRCHSSAGAFRTDDGGETCDRSINGLVSPGELPDKTAEVGHCVHNLATHPSRRACFSCRKHWDVMRSDNAGDSWHEVSGNLPSDFGFRLRCHAHEPNTVYVIPIKSDSEHIPPDGKLRVYRSRSGGDEWEALTKGLPQKRLLCWNVCAAPWRLIHSTVAVYTSATTAAQVYASIDFGR